MAVAMLSRGSTFYCGKFIASRGGIFFYCGEQNYCQGEVIFSLWKNH